MNTILLNSFVSVKNAKMLHSNQVLSVFYRFLSYIYVTIFEVVFKFSSAYKLDHWFSTECHLAH